MARSRTFDGRRNVEYRAQMQEYLVRWNALHLRAVASRELEASDKGQDLTLSCARHRWSNGDAFNADDVIHNLTGWWRPGVEANWSPTGWGALVKSDNQNSSTARSSGRRLQGRLLLRADISLLAGHGRHPALIMHRSYDGAPIRSSLRSRRACELVSWQPQVGAEVPARQALWKASTGSMA